VTIRISKDDIANLEKYHQALASAERGGRWREALEVNWQFHHTLYQAADAQVRRWALLMISTAARSDLRSSAASRTPSPEEAGITLAAAYSPDISSNATMSAA